MSKTRTYTKMRIPAGVLAHRVLNYLQERGYEVSYSYDEAHKTWANVQARKYSKLRTAMGQRRCLEIQFRKQKNALKISIGSGQWGKNTIMSAIPMVAFPVLGFVNFISSATSSKMSEAELWDYIDSVATQY